MQDLDVVDLLTRPGTFVLAVAIYLLVLMVRRVTESAWPSLKKQADANSPEVTYLTKTSRWWNEVILYFLPVAVGALAGLLKSEFLFGTIGDRGGKILLGVCIGWFSGFLYKCLKRMIAQKTGVSLDADSIPPKGA